MYESQHLHDLNIFVYESQHFKNYQKWLSMKAKTSRVLNYWVWKSNTFTIVNIIVYGGQHFKN